jgi:ribosomal protein S18 acetylase RimI-like enzyme
MNKREQVVADAAAKNLGQASRFNFHAVYSNGCTLKCVARRYDVATNGARGRGASVGSGAGAHGVGAAQATSWEKGAGSQPDKLVGFVSFSMEEGEKSGEPRRSKRLKRKKGESDEYTKVNHLLITDEHRGSGLGALLLLSVLRLVLSLDPNYARELFLTVIKKNDHAVRLYERLSLTKIGENTTYVAKEKSDKTKPVVWYQMGLKLEHFRRKEESAQANTRAKRTLVQQISDTSVNGSLEKRQVGPPAVRAAPQANLTDYFRPY